MFRYYRHGFHWSILLICILLAPIVIYFSSRYYRRKLIAALTQLYQGNLHAFDHYSFQGARVEQLYFPFTEDELRMIGRCRKFTHHDLTVEPMRGSNCFHIACHIEGINDQYEPFFLQREGYLYINCYIPRSSWHPCIDHVERRNTPFDN